MGDERIILSFYMASRLPLRLSMKRMVLLATIIILIGFLSVTRCHHPVPSAAMVEIVPGVVAKADKEEMDQIVAAFDRAESAVQKGDLEALMAFYSMAYNYHGLKHADVRRVWDEVFTHYRDVNSRHVFTEFKLIQAGRARKAYVTCTGGLFGTEKRTGKPITIDSWVSEVHFLVKEEGVWRFLGNKGGPIPSAPPTSAPHHPLF